MNLWCLNQEINTNTVQTNALMSAVIDIYVYVFQITEPDSSYDWQ